MLKNILNEKSKLSDSDPQKILALPWSSVS